MQSHCTPGLEMLRRLCRFVNRESFEETDCRDTCIYTSAVLLDVLTALGIEARPMRVEAVAFGTAGAVILGSEGDGSRRPVAKPGMWNGHLAIVAMGQYLLDATLDQIVGAEPFVGEVTPRWLLGAETLWWVDGQRAEGFPRDHADSAIRYHALPGRGGWKSAPDFRPTRRRWLVKHILSVWEG